MRERIENTIEAIRRKPEHVRVWYVWGGVGIVMLFVVLIWIFTLKENLGRSSSGNEIRSLQEKLPVGAGLSGEKQSIEDMFGSGVGPGMGNSEGESNAK